MKDRHIVAAHNLAVRFTNDADLPSRFRRKTETSMMTRKVTQDSEIEKRFETNVDSWLYLIETMLSKIDEKQAWRFINLLPQIEVGTAKLTENRDFCDFIDYFILRRDIEQCDTDELGGLALLSVAFQRKIEMRIQ